jgi:hypothetical protein
VGRIAAEHLLSAIGGQPTHGARAVPCRLVLRDSAGNETTVTDAGNGQATSGQAAV